jgi:hypothetical protein
MCGEMDDRGVHFERRELGYGYGVNLFRRTKNRGREVKNFRPNYYLEDSV